MVSIRNNFGTVHSMLTEVAQAATTKSGDILKRAEHAKLKAKLLYLSCSVAFSFTAFIPIWTPGFSSQTLPFRFACMWLFVYSVFILQVLVSIVKQPKRRTRSTVKVQQAPSYRLSLLTRLVVGNGAGSVASSIN